MTIRTFLAAPVQVVKTAYAHLRRGPPRPTWSFSMHLGVAMLRSVMEDNKTSIRSARRYTEVVAPTHPNVRLTRTRIPRRESVNVLGLLSDTQRRGFIKGEWLDYVTREQRRAARARRRGGAACCGACGPQAETPTHDPNPSPIDPAAAPPQAVLYLHGGAYIICSPKTHRWLTWRLARNAHARVLAVHYRRAPEFTFPCALHDAISAYLHLIDPPAGEPRYDPANVAIAGDSAGGNLALALSLWLKRNGYPLPGAMALFSPWVDLLHSLPSYRSNAPFDYLPAEVGDPRWLPRPSELPIPPPPRVTLAAVESPVVESAAEDDSGSDTGGMLPARAVEADASSRLASVADDATALNSPAAGSDPDPKTQDTPNPQPKGAAEQREFYFHLAGAREADPDALPLPLIHNAQYYAPDPLLRHPYISPMYGASGEWQAIARSTRILILTGDAERLCDESIVMAGKLVGAVAHDSPTGEPRVSDDGDLDPTLTSRVHLELYRDGVHVVPLFFKGALSRSCLRRAGEFLYDALRGGSPLTDAPPLVRVDATNTAKPLSLVEQLGAVHRASAAIAGSLS